MGLSLPASPWLGRAPNNLVPFKGSVELKLSLFVMYCINLNSVLHDVTVHGIVISHTQTFVKYTIQVCVCVRVLEVALCFTPFRAVFHSQGLSLREICP